MNHFCVFRILNPQDERAWEFQREAWRQTTGREPGAFGLSKFYPFPRAPMDLVHFFTTYVLTYLGTLTVHCSSCIVHS